LRWQSAATSRTHRLKSAASNLHVFVPTGMTSYSLRCPFTKYGRIVFIEPDHEGSLYEAEVLFSACDGDERKAKQRAEEVILTHPHLRHETLITDETQFRFRSFQAFVAAAHPKRNLSHARDFLKKHEEDGWFVLRAPRKIWVCSPRETA